MPDTAAVVAGYITMWNETDPTERRRLVTETMTEDAATWTHS